MECDDDAKTQDTYHCSCVVVLFDLLIGCCITMQHGHVPHDHVSAVVRRMPRLFQVLMGGIFVAIVVETSLLWIELQINQGGAGFSDDVGMPMEVEMPPSSLHLQQQQQQQVLAIDMIDMTDGVGPDSNPDHQPHTYQQANHTYPEPHLQVVLVPHNDDLQGSNSSGPAVQVLQCHEDQNRTYCCAESWEHNVDPWWQQHIDWEISVENDTTFCFSPIRDERRRSYLKHQIYPLQWQTNCTNVKSQILSNSGFAANLGLNGKAFMGANQINATFVSVKKRSNALWRYAVWPNGRLS